MLCRQKVLRTSALSASKPRNGYIPLAVCHTLAVRPWDSHRASKYGGGETEFARAVPTTRVGWRDRRNLDVEGGELV